MTWGSCSETCGDGYRRRTRDIIQEDQFGGKECLIEDSMDVEPCNYEPCTGDVEKLKYF